MAMKALGEEMNPRDKLVFEDVTMAMAAYIRSVAHLTVSADHPYSHGAIDAAWEEFKTRAGGIFTRWHGEAK